MTEGSKKAIAAAFLANLGIAISKFLAFLVTGAASMLAESIHSVADTGNQGLLFLGGRRARLAPDEDHPFGYGSERYFWAFVVALVLFSLGALFAGYEGVEKLRHPHELESPVIAVVVLIVAIGLESLSLRTAVREASPVRGRRGWWSFVRTSKSPEIPVVLLEDVGALLGLALALTGVALASLTGESRWDALGSLAIAALLGVIAVVLAVEMKSLLIGESASPDERAAIEGAIRATPGIDRVIHLKTLHLGPDEVLVAAKVALAPGRSVAETAAVIDAAEAAVRAAVPSVRPVYLEPDLERSGS